jgi:poly(A) polymerase
VTSPVDLFHCANAPASALALYRLPFGQGMSVGQLLEALAADGIEAYVCGGAVRDVLAGQPFNDVDLVARLPIVALEQWFVSRFGEDCLRYRNHSFGLIKLGHGAELIDVTMFRSAASIKPGQTLAEVCYDLGEDLLADARNRDLSINCLYWNLDQGFVDPTGQGIEDLRARRLNVAAEPRKCAVDHRISFRLMAFVAREFSLSDEAAAYLRVNLPRDLAVYDDASLSDYLAVLLRGRRQHADTVLQTSHDFLGTADCKRLADAIGRSSGWHLQ